MRDHSRLRRPLAMIGNLKLALPAEAVRGRYEHYSIGMPWLFFWIIGRNVVVPRRSRVSRSPNTASNKMWI